MFSNLLGQISFFGGKKTTVKNSIFGLDKEFKADQCDYNQPFEDGYITSSDVYSINRMIANATKSIEWKLKRATGDKIEDVTSGQLFELLNKPNENQTLEEFIENCSLNYTISGNLFLKKDLVLGFSRPTSISCLPPQSVNIVVKKEGFEIKPSLYQYCLLGETLNIPVDEVVHLKYTNPSLFGIQSLRGLSPLTAGYLTLVGLNGNQTASASIYKHQGAAGILSNESEYTLNADQQKLQQKLFDEKSAGATLFGKIIQSAAKVKYTKLGLDPSQLQLIEGKAMKVRDLCNIYGIDSVLMNDPNGSTYNNVKEAEKAFWNKVVIPNAKSILRAYTKAVVESYNELEFKNGKSKYFIELNTESVLALKDDEVTMAMKSKVVAETYSIMLRDGVITKEQYALAMGFNYIQQ